MMSGPKFVIGQSVDFERTTLGSRANGPYEVTRVLPADARNSCTYRVKSKVEPFERAVNEYDLIAVAAPPSERLATPWPTVARKPRR